MQTQDSPSSWEPKAEAILRALHGCNSHAKLRRFHALSLTAGLLRLPSVSAALLRFCAVSSAGSLPHARLLFRHHVESPRADHWNSLIRGNDDPKEAISLYNEMVTQSSAKPDKYTFSFVLKACDRIGSGRKSLELHGSALRRGLVGDVLVATNLVRAYCEIGSVCSARRVFDEMPVRDLIAWNAMISCYYRMGLHREAVETYERMSEANVGPDEFTIVAVLSSFADSGALSGGIRAHRTARERGILGSVFVGNALVDMYAKCGELGSAVGVFEAMRRRDVLSWNSVIVGFGRNGDGKKAIEYFARMVRDGIEPNSVTFLGVLGGCSHQGLVDEGVDFFRSMSIKYKVKPGIKHYGCLVDLFGRAGKIEKALEVIETCPLQNDPVLWRTLLGSCRIHRAIGIGETAMRNLVELGAANAGDCVLLGSIYRESNDAFGVARMRKMIKSRGVKTSPGWSWIELGSEVHRFVVDDRSHAFSDEIYSKLNEVISALYSVGYVGEEPSPSSGSSYHSEKLAIAFGIARTEEGTGLRIVKNLRVCRDCHSFTKCVSKAFNREIIVRDRVRFHHFKDGVCSCKDYW